VAMDRGVWDWNVPESVLVQDESQKGKHGVCFGSEGRIIWIPSDWALSSPEYVVLGAYAPTQTSEAFEGSMWDCSSVASDGKLGKTTLVLEELRQCRAVYVDFFKVF
jgi:hypothetical protein